MAIKCSNIFMMIGKEFHVEIEKKNPVIKILQRPSLFRFIVKILQAVKVVLNL